MAEKKTGFNLAEALAGVSKLDTGIDGREQIEYIDITLIDDDPNNFYKLTDIDALAENIELLGLQQPIRVRTNPENSDRVIIVSGHRRRKAILQLVKSGREDLRKIPCIREGSEGSAALQELRLIYANSDTRKLTPAEISKQAERVEMLLYQLKEEGYEFPGRMRDHVAAACKVSAPKLARLKVIRESLSPDFMPDFEKGVLPEQTAYTLARFPLDFQHRIFKVVSCKDIKGYVLDGVLKKYEEGWRWEPTIKCPDGRGCTHGDAALRHDLEYSYDRCGGNRCCLECEAAKQSYSPCDRMCSKAKAQRKEVKAAADAKEAKKQRKQAEKYQKATQANAQRLIRAIDAAGLADDAKIQWRYYDDTAVGTIRKYADGDFENSGSWYGARLEPKELTHPIEVARQLGCSTDYLLGLTDELKHTVVPPAAGWVPLQFVNGMKEPPKSGKYYCRFDCDGAIIKQLAWWDGVLGTWSFKDGGAKIDAKCLGWFPLPGDDEE